MILYADLGMSAWGVFQVGLMNVIGLSFGQASQVVGLGVLIFGWFLGFPPGFGTVSNMFFIGYFIDVIIGLGIVPKFNNIVLQLVLLVAGMAMIGVASYFYLSPKLGAGPRDGLMIGLIQKLMICHFRQADSFMQSRHHTYTSQFLFSGIDRKISKARIGQAV